jgi:hypothetical protein
MTPTVMFVVLLAALLHAGWNFLVQSAADKAQSMTALVLGHAPFALVARALSPWPRLDSRPYLLAGACLHPARGRSAAQPALRQHIISRNFPGRA